MKRRTWRLLLGTVLAYALVAGTGTGTAQAGEAKAAGAGGWETGVSLYDPPSDSEVADACQMLTLALNCGGVLDPSAVVAAAAAVADGCSADGGVCAKADHIADASIGLAAACTNKALSDAGFQFSVDPPTSGLSCEDASLAALYLTTLVTQEVHACKGTAGRACVVVLDAVSHVIDRALGCTVGALNAAGVNTTSVVNGGTDLACGEAVYAVQAVAKGLAELLGGCLGSGESSDTCRLVTETATFVVDNLNGCVGELWIPADQVDAPRPFGGTLNCFGVIDQANQSLDGLIQRVPAVPWTISPGDECSITVGWPSAPAEPLGTSDTVLERPALIPPCYPPDSLTNGVYTPAPPGYGLTPPTCTPGSNYEVTTKWQDQLVPRTGSVYQNPNIKEAYHKDEVTKVIEMSARITAHTEVQAKVVLAKAKAALKVELYLAYSQTHTFGVYNRVPPKTVDDVTMGGFRKVVSGHFTRVYDDCARFEKDVMIKAPWKDGTRAVQYPLK